MAKKTAKTVGMVEITLTNDELMNEFYPAISHLGSLAIKNVDILTKIVKARRAAKVLVDEYNETRKALLEQDCLKDSEDKPIIETDEELNRSDYTYETPELKMAALKGVSELLRKEVSFEVPQVKLTALRNVAGMSGNAIDQLRDFIIL